MLSLVALVSIKYVHTLVSFNFIITVIFSDCISDPLNVRDSKIMDKTNHLIQFCYLSAGPSMAPLCIVSSLVLY